MSKRVLIVEDSRTQALRLSLELQRHGLVVAIAMTGTAGLKAAQEQPPDVIVLDIELPEMNGYALCRELKADPRTAHIPVVMLTRHDQAADTLKGLEVGADDYIPKDSFAEHNLVQSLRHLSIV
jgi:two-component system cell cycle response regulator